MFHLQHICTVHCAYLYWGRVENDEGGIVKIFAEDLSKVQLLFCQMSDVKNNGSDRASIVQTEACHSCEGCCMIKGGMLIFLHTFGRQPILSLQNSPRQWGAYQD